MTVRFRLLVKPRFRRQLAVLEQAAASQPGSLRDRELRALRLGLQALAEGREAELGGKRLGYSPGHHDLRDCAELKIPVIPESRYGNDLGPSHRLIYREFEPEDGGLPYREVVCFEPRRANRPFDVAGARLQRAVGRPDPALAHLPNHRPGFQYGGAEPTGPPRLPLPPDLSRALAAASGIAPASGAVERRLPAGQPRVGPRRAGPPAREL